MKLKFKGENCFQGRTYHIAADCIIVEVLICTTAREMYQYFVKHPENDEMLLFSFGVPADDTTVPRDTFRFSREDLTQLYMNGYFDKEIARLSEED